MHCCALLQVAHQVLKEFRRNHLQAGLAIELPNSIRSTKMPKMKTKKSAAKRFLVRSSGSIKRGHAFKRHILTKKTTKSKRQLRGMETIHKSDIGRVRDMMPYA